MNYHKLIPKYRQVMLEALEHYPELAEVHIEFRLAKKHPVPYGTRPTAVSYFRAPSKRRYRVTLLENASGPEEQALFKNLGYRAQLGVLAHELGHIVQFQNKSRLELLKMSLGFVDLFKRREIERDADIQAIEHDLGEGLYTHAKYIRTINGYAEKRKELNIVYLKPHEILEAVSQRKTGIGV